MATYETTTVTEVNAVLFDGENVNEVMELFENADFLLTHGVIQGEEITILTVRYLDKKEQVKKLTIRNNQYMVSGRSYKVIDRDKFEDKYTLVD